MADLMIDGDLSFWQYYQSISKAKQVDAFLLPRNARSP